MKMQKKNTSFSSMQITYSFEFASKLRLRNSSILCPVCCSQAVFSASNARLFSSNSRTCCSNERRICSCLLCNYLRISRIRYYSDNYVSPNVKTPCKEKFVSIENNFMRTKKDLDWIKNYFLKCKIYSQLNNQWHNSRII